MHELQPNECLASAGRTCHENEEAPLVLSGFMRDAVELPELPVLLRQRLA